MLVPVFRLPGVRAACHVSRAAVRAAVGSPKYLLIARPAEAGAVMRSISALSRGSDTAQTPNGTCLGDVALHACHTLAVVTASLGGGDGSKLNSELKQQKVEGKRWEKAAMRGLHRHSQRGFVGVWRWGAPSDSPVSLQTSAVLCAGGCALLALSSLLAIVAVLLPGGACERRLCTLAGYMQTAAGK